jgi:group I intron endonuclease
MYDIGDILVKIRKSIARGIIYKATNVINGKIYIGLTTRSFKERIIGHRSDALKGSTTYFHNALRKYGFENFEWVVIDECKEFNELCCLEQFYIKYFQTNNKNFGYNLTKGGEGTFGYKPTYESIQKWKNSLPDRSGENNPFYGKRHSKETRKILSNKRKGKNHRDYRHDLNDKEIIRLYTQEKFSIRKIAKILKCNPSTIANRLQKNNVQLRNYREAQQGKNLFGFTGFYKLKDRNPWVRVWNSTISYKGNPKSLGLFNDPLSCDIIYNFVKEEIE